MKIAVWHNLPSGGGKRALYYHVRGLVKRGHKVSCWSLDNADKTYLPLAEFGPERIVPLKEPATKLLSWTPNYSAAVSRLQAFDEACRICAAEIDAGEFDLLFANSAQSYYVPYLMRRVRMKKVLYLQEPGRYLYEARPILPWVSTAPDDLQEASLFPSRRLLSEYANVQTLRLQAKQEWLNVQACDRVLVNSQFSRENILRTYGVDAKVCYLGVDTKLFRDLGLTRERTVVGLGSFDPIKGIDLAVRAIALLPEPRPTLKWIANSGSEDYQHSVQDLARSIGVDLQIRQAVSDSELVTALNQASLLLCTARLEPFGFAPLEANACGLPVVGIAEGGIRETIQHGLNGYLVEPEAAPIAEAIQKLLENPARAREMGTRATEHIQQHWDVESSVDRLEKNLQEVVQQ